VIYLRNFRLLDEDREWRLLVDGEKKNIYNNIYPFKIFPDKELTDISFDNITIFYGNNGSGKTTLLNIISEKIKAKRKSDIEFGRYFEMYVDSLESADISEFNIPDEIKFISSNDIFDFLLDVQAINNNVNRKKDELALEYMNYKYTDSSNFYNDLEALKKKNKANKETISKYIRTNLGNNNIISQSNGETALSFFHREIKENSIYILDEPENSLSPSNQIKLKQFIEESVRFFNCQFIISTHSPFLLSLNNAKIYDLDDVPARTKNFLELENIKEYIELFRHYI
jgi:predicted ATPase